MLKIGDPPHGAGSLHEFVIHPLVAPEDRRTRHVMLFEDPQPLFTWLLREPCVQSSDGDLSCRRRHQIRHLAVDSVQREEIEKPCRLERLHEERLAERREEEPCAVCAPVELVVRDAATAATGLAEDVSRLHGAGLHRLKSVKSAHDERLAQPRPPPFVQTRGYGQGREGALAVCQHRCHQPDRPVLIAQLHSRGPGQGREESVVGGEVGRGGDRRPERHPPG